LIVMQDPLPRNALGKVDKQALRALWPSLTAKTENAGEH
jgi:hypothetical protein